MLIIMYEIVLHPVENNVLINFGFELLEYFYPNFWMNEELHGKTLAHGKSYNGSPMKVV